MSYEGYVQCLCSNGHYDEEPEPYGMDILNDIGLCSCGAKRIWCNSVDVTNGPAVDEIDMEPFKISDEKVEVCNLGHAHVTEEARYRIPTEEEKKKALELSRQKLHDSGDIFY